MVIRHGNWPCFSTTNYSWWLKWKKLLLQHWLHSTLRRPRRTKLICQKCFECLKIAKSTIEMPWDKQNCFIFSMGSLSKWLSLVMFYCEVNFKAKTVVNGSNAISAWKCTIKTNFFISDTFLLKLAIW